jgi:hypothetical protein
MEGGKELSQEDMAKDSRAHMLWKLLNSFLQIPALGRDSDELQALAKHRQQLGHILPKALGYCLLPRVFTFLAILGAQLELEGDKDHTAQNIPSAVQPAAEECVAVIDTALLVIAETSGEWLLMRRDFECTLLRHVWHGVEDELNEMNGGLCSNGLVLDLLVMRGFFTQRSVL